ncbi:MAG: cytochrome c [Pseudomonadota bacterium]
MKIFLSRRLLPKLALLLSIATHGTLALASTQQVDNFRLQDHQGNSHELFYYRDAAAIAILIRDASCATNTKAQRAFAEAGKIFRDRGVEFFVLDSAPGKSAQSGDIPILQDRTQIIGAALQTTHAGETIIVDPQTWSIVYRGDLLGSEANTLVHSTLKKMINKQPVEFQSTQTQGCTIQHQAPATEISYSEHVAPILLDKCASCHREGGIGSWAMSDYNMVRGFAPMIREVVRTQRMPPWHADPQTGHWRNDRSLSDDEVRTLVHWIEAGALHEGDQDPLADAELTYPKWEVAEVLGEPDFIIELPATEIPATGVMDYLDYYVENPIGRDVWVQAAEVLPGDRSVLHHTISMYGERTFFDRLIGDFSPRGALRHYAPGISNRPFPEDTGVYLPKDAVFEFQMHYTTTGRPTVDQTKVGIWVYDEPPTHSVRSFFIQNRRIDIPAHASNHREEKTTVVPKDAILYSLLPHAHYRGKAAEFTAIYPDDTQEVLLSVPNYDFNWQTAYEFAEPKFVPAGTKLVQVNWWDNSARNLANPDPGQDVGWGDQSWEEMLFGEVTLRFVDAAEAALLVSTATTR